MSEVGGGDLLKIAWSFDGIGFADVLATGGTAKNFSFDGIGFRGLQISASTTVAVPGVAATGHAGTATPLAATTPAGLAATLGAGVPAAQITTGLAGLLAALDGGVLAAVVSATPLGADAAATAGLILFSALDATVTPAGRATALSLGHLTPAVSATAPGLAATTAPGTPATAQGFILPGLAAALSLGHLTPALAVEAPGAALGSLLGSLTPFDDYTAFDPGIFQGDTFQHGNAALTDNTVALDGLDLLLGLGRLRLRVDTPFDGNALDLGLGAILALVGVPLDGQALTLSLGTLAIAGDHDIALDGLAAVLALGDLHPAGSVVVSAPPLTAGLGQITPSLTITPAGRAALLTAGSFPSSRAFALDGLAAVLGLGQIATTTLTKLAMPREPCLEATPRDPCNAAIPRGPYDI